jgi:ribosomal-protein-serine acetyltransferase
MPPNLPLLPGVELRPGAHADLDEIVALVQANLDHLMPWMPWAHPGYGREDAERWASLPDDTSWVIVREGAACGVIGFNHPDPLNRTLAIGYWLGADAVGHGIVTAAVRVLARHAFDDLETHRIELRASVTNARSQAVAARCGFTFEGIARGAEYVGGVHRDLRVYSLLATD